MRILIGVVLLASSVAAQAQILKCVGKDGKIEFATACAPGTKQQDTGVSSRPAPTPPPAKDAKGGDAPKSLSEREADFKKRQSEKAEADAKSQKTAAEDAQRQRACADSQSYLKSLQDRQRIRKTDPKTGERVFYEEDDYVRETAVAQKNVADNCK